MRFFIAKYFIVFVCIFLFFSCSNKEKIVTINVSDSQTQTTQNNSSYKKASKPEKDMSELVLKDTFFEAQCNDIYSNPEDYFGRRISLEGMYTSQKDEQTGIPFDIVYRRSPGCCGNDGMPGFEFHIQDSSTAKPKDNDWIEVKGSLEKYSYQDFDTIVIIADSVKILPYRGKEFVNN